MKLHISKKFLTVFLIFCVVLCIGLGLFLFPAFIGDKQEPISTEAVSSTVTDDAAQAYYQGNWYRLKDQLETVLVMGVDKYDQGSTSDSYTNNQQADFLLLLVIDHANKTYTELHLNRDTMTTLQVLGLAGQPAGTITGQLALAHTYGTGGKDSCRNTADAVSDLLYGMNIQHYISIPMSSVATINDMVGGVTVTVLDDFSEIDPALVQGQEVTLKGEQALIYVRTRASLEDSSNLHRMERQRQYMSALSDKLQKKVKEDPNFSADMMLSLSDSMVSDYTANQLSDLSEYLSSYESQGFLTLEGEAVEGEEFMEFYVDENALQDTIIDVFYEPVSQTKSNDSSAK